MYSFTDIISEKKLYEYEFIALMFELLYALMVSRKILGFVHKDLISDNILIKEYNNPISRSYTIYNKHFYVYSKYIPYITDYNNSIISEIVISSGDFYNIISKFKSYLKYSDVSILKSNGLSNLKSTDDYFKNDTNHETDKIQDFILKEIIFDNSTIYDILKNQQVVVTKYKTPFIFQN